MKQLTFLIALLAALQSSAQERIVEPHLRHRCVRSKKMYIDAKVSEGSGLALWNGRLWTHNDSGDAALFAMDTLGKIIETYELPGVKNNDWEDMAQDEKFFYIGDTGNNIGEKDTVFILRIDKQSLLARSPKIDSIALSWPDVGDGQNRVHVNFDCEAIVKAGDSLYLFTKEWKKRRCTRLFSIPARPGKHVAKYLATMPTRVLVTGASWNQQNKTLALCGYNLWLRPFVLVFQDADLSKFSPKNQTKIKVRRTFRQTEGIAPDGRGGYYLINEDSRFVFLHHDQQLHRVNVAKLLPDAKVGKNIPQ